MYKLLITSTYSNRTKKNTIEYYQVR